MEDINSLYQLDRKRQTKGVYTTQDDRIVAFARTIGYEQYDGLGWFGVVEQKRLSDKALMEKLKLELETTRS